MERERERERSEFQVVTCTLYGVNILYAVFIHSFSLPLSNQAHSRVVDHDRPLLELETELECWRLLARVSPRNTIVERQV